MTEEDTACKVAELSLSTETKADEGTSSSSSGFNSGSELIIERPIRKQRSKRKPSVAKGKKLTKKQRLASPLEFQYNQEFITKKIGIHRMRDLILWLLAVEQQHPGWVDVANKSALKNIVFLLVGGITSRDVGYESLSDHLVPQQIKEAPTIQFFKNHFDEVIPVQLPGSKDSTYSAMQSLINFPINRKEKQDLLRASADDKIYLPDLLMSYHHLIANGYPIHPLTAGLSATEVQPLEDGWVETKVFEHEGSKTFALDCEMCLSAEGKELTRISILDFNNRVIMDELVKPQNEIIDYVTTYSGIKEEDLKDVTTTLKDIQDRVLSIISADDILIGHSLESDLNVLKLRHPKIIDTSIIYEHPSGPPSKQSLRNLAKTYLDSNIQGGTKGHSPVIDSETCMNLVKLKVVNGRNFGKIMREISIFKKFSNLKNKRTVSASIVDYEMQIQDGFDPNFESRVKCSNDEEIVQNVIKLSSSTNLTIAKLRELEFAKRFASPPYYCKLKIDTVENAYLRLDKHLEQIYESLPDKTVLMICTGVGDTTEMLRLQKERREYLNQSPHRMRKEVEKEWDQEHFLALKQATLVAREGVAFLLIKGSAKETSEAEEAII